MVTGLIREIHIKFQWYYSNNRDNELIISAIYVLWT